ncbi:hypothetical protein E4U43_001765 [Claviceps pusilla]|uniref:Uncharacterized protein n=1 Tax=Claviceps pusilla TaxID=123648 RepID=A0A9P7NH06_9HYPO|nr:hypothetical protein E4U43_001765 [Claviceps pusilla]
MNTLENNLSISPEATEHPYSQANPRFRYPPSVATLPQVSVRLSDIDAGRTMDPTTFLSCFRLDWSLSLKPIEGRKNIKCSDCNRVLKKTLSRFDRYVSFRDYSEPCSQRFRTSQESHRTVQAESRAYFGASHNGGSPRSSQTLLEVPSSSTSLLLPSIELNAMIKASCEASLQLFSNISVPAVAPFSNLSPFSLSQISLGRNMEADSTRVRTSPSILLALHSQAKRGSSKCGHNTIAIALGINVFRRILESSLPNFGLHGATLLGGFAPEVLSSTLSTRCNSGPAALAKKFSRQKTRHWLTLVTSSTIQIRVLDAPNLRDDFYCSVLAYSPSLQTLAVGLGNIVYTWSDKDGVHAINGVQQEGRSDGSFVIMSLVESAPRFEIQQPRAVACLSWRPRAVLRFSSKPCSSNVLVPTEDLIVGDECGELYYYLVEWPENGSHRWPGSVTLIVRIGLHNQQICGLAWSSNGDMFASGANDNLCQILKAALTCPRETGHISSLKPDCLLAVVNCFIEDLIDKVPMTLSREHNLRLSESFPTVCGD